MPKNIAVTFFVDEEPSVMIPMARDTSFAEVRQRWREVSGDSSLVIFLRESLDGAALPEEGSLGDILPPGRTILGLHVLCAEEKTVRVLGSQMAPLSVHLLPGEMLEGLMQRVKGLFGIEKQRVARLLSGGRVLDEKVPPCVQLAGCAELELDLLLPFLACCIEPGAFQPVLRDERGRLIRNGDLSEVLKEVGEGVNPAEPLALPAFARPVDVRPLRLFGSEPARALTGPGAWRAIAWGSGARIEGDEAVCALAAEALLSGAVSGVVLERRIEVRIEDKLRRTLRKEAVWPSSKPADLLTRDGDCLLLEGEPMNPRQCLWEAGIQAGTCLSVTRLLPLSVFDQDGTIKRVTADLGESLLDLRERLCMPEDAFELRSGGEVLRGGERSLLELELDVSGVLVALPRSRAVVLCPGGAEPVSLGKVRKTTGFKAFLQAASEALKTPLARDTRFVCCCGRIFSGESEERRQFPLRCCRAPELRFSVVQASQGEANQTAWKTKEASVQTNTTVGRALVQSNKAVSREVTQVGSAPARPRIAHFFIAWHYDLSPNFNLDLPFKGAPLGRELRTAITEARGVKAELLELRQFRARRKNGAALVEVEGSPDWADEQGRRAADGEVEEIEENAILDDERVGTAGPLHARISVYKI